jgi:hypothetical protein
MLRALIILAATITLFGSCKKDPKPVNETPNTTGFSQTNSIQVNITNMAGNQILSIGTQTYINQNQDTFSISKYLYYISNIKLTREDNVVFTEPESYRLVDVSDSTTCKFTINNVPLGNYKSIEFIIGVDSLRNCDGAQTGALNPLNDMFWSWNQGYIFAKMEGLSNNANGGAFIYHLGGFTQPYNSIVKATPSFGSNLIQVDADHVSKLYLKADALEWFKTPLQISLFDYSAVSGGKKSKELAVNYSDMFTVAAITHE